MPFACQEKRRQRYLQMIRHDADIISAVSHGFLEMMHFDDVGRVLSNGFDREDLPQVETQQKDECLRIVYCGQLQDSRRTLGDRDLTPMFRCLRHVIDEEKMNLAQIKLIYAGREGNLFTHYAAQSGLESCVEDHGHVSRDQSIALQKSADILLMASHHTASQKGILTGKLFEYMMMDKPIVCCMGGDVPNSAVKKVMEETGIGCCREEAAAQADDPRLLDALRRLVNRWKAGQPLLDGRNREAVEAYSYPRLAQTLDNWIDE